MLVCQAEVDDISYIADLSRRVQDGFIASGSLQMIGPIAPETVAHYVATHAAYILKTPERRLGSVFIGLVTSETFHAFSAWEVDRLPQPVLFFSKFMIEPSYRGQGIGQTLLEGALRLAWAQHPSATVMLDCWAGNSKLRDYYTRSGFTLYGEYPEDDFMVAAFMRRPPTA